MSYDSPTFNGGRIAHITIDDKSLINLWYENGCLEYNV